MMDAGFSFVCETLFKARQTNKKRGKKPALFSELVTPRPSAPMKKTSTPRVSETN